MFFNQSLLDRHGGTFPFFIIKNIATVNMLVKGLGLYALMQTLVKNSWSVKLPNQTTRIVFKVWNTHSGHTIKSLKEGHQTIAMLY